MRYPASEKVEIMRLVAQPACRRAERLSRSGGHGPPSTAGMINTRPAAPKRWKIGDRSRAGYGTGSLMIFGIRSSSWRLSRRSYHSVLRFTDTKDYFVSEATAYRPPAPQAILPRPAVQAYATLQPAPQGCNPRQTLS